MKLTREILEGSTATSMNGESAIFYEKTISVRTIILAGCLLLQLSTPPFHSRSAAGTWTCPLIPALASWPVTSSWCNPYGKGDHWRQFTRFKASRASTSPGSMPTAAATLRSIPGIATTALLLLLCNPMARCSSVAKSFITYAMTEVATISTTPSLSGSTPTEA